MLRDAILQPRIEHILRAQLLRQKSGDNPSVRLMLLHPHRQTVFTPRSTRYASNAARIPPVAFCTKRNRSACSGFVPINTPPNPSECPFKNFVVECITMSAPHSIGRCRYGDKNELSTLISTPASLQIAATARRSVNCILGFAGVSTCTSFVCGRIAARTFSATVVSTYVNVRPYPAQHLIE